MKKLLFILSFVLLYFSGFSQTIITPKIVVPGSTSHNQMFTKGGFQTYLNGDTSSYHWWGLDGDNVIGTAHLYGVGQRWVHYGQTSAGPDWWTQDIFFDTLLNNWQTTGNVPGEGFETETAVSSVKPMYQFNPYYKLSGGATPPFDVIYSTPYNVYKFQNSPNLGVYLLGGVFRNSAIGSFYHNFNPAPFIPQFFIDTVGKYNGFYYKNTDTTMFLSPDVNGTFQLKSVINAAGNAFIQNQNAVLQPTANFAISGNGNMLYVVTRNATSSGGSAHWSLQNGNTQRWQFGLNGTESGSNTGSNLFIARANDAGTLIDFPLTINRATGTVTFADGLMVTGPIVGNGVAPGISAGAGAGTGPTISMTGSQHSGSISITTGTTPTATSVVATVTFTNPFPSDGILIITPKNGAAAALTGNANVFVSSGNATTATISVGSTALTGSTTYQYWYSISGF